MKEKREELSSKIYYNFLQLIRHEVYQMTVKEVDNKIRGNLFILFEEQLYIELNSLFKIRWKNQKV